jgi:type IV fimbrial biogenesis protein FimT
MPSQPKGFTLIEIIITIIVAIIFFTLALPAFQNFLTTYQLKSTVQIFYQDLKWAQALALKNQAPVYVNVVTGDTWCYGISDSNNNCNCSTSPTSCTVAGTQKIVVNTSGVFAGTTVTEAALSNSQLFYFEALHGSPNLINTWTFTNNSLSIGISVNSLGRITLCSTTIQGYDNACS